MALNFPDAPTEGLVYASGGTSWVFTSGVWMGASTEAGGGITSLSPGADITLTPNPIIDTGSVAVTASTFLRLTGGTLTGPLTVDNDFTVSGLAIAPTPPPGDDSTRLSTTEYVQDALAALPPSGIPEAPLDGQAYGRDNAAWTPVLPISGGTLTGELRAPYVKAQDAGGTNYIQMTAGLVGWYNHSGVRVGYIGNSDTDMTIACELSSTLTVYGKAHIQGDHALIHGTHPLLGLWDQGAGLYGIWSDNNLLKFGTIDGTIQTQATLLTLDGTGVVTATAPPLADNSTKLVTSAWVKSQGYGASVSITGGTGITVSPSPLTGTGSIALTVPVAISSGGTGATTAPAALTALGAAPILNAALQGVPTAPTPAPGTNTTQLATAAFVQSAVAAIPGGVSSFNTRTGAVTLLAADVTGVGGALLAGPAFTGTPTAPTATAGTNTTQLATTAFVRNALSGIGGITIAPTPPSTPQPGDLWWDSSDGSGQLFIYFDDGNSAQFVVANALPASLPPRYTIGFSYVGGVLPASQLLGLHRVGKAVTIPADFAPYNGYASMAGGTAVATATTVISVDRALAASPTVFSQIGTVTIGAGTVAPSFATVGGAAVSCAQGDIIRLIGPAVADATLANFYCTLVAQEQ